MRTYNKKVLTIFGTRPEAIKLAPVLRALRTRSLRLHSLVCVTAQHRQMLDQVLEVFGIQPDYDLDLMRPGQSLADITAGAVSGLTKVIQEVAPDIVVVHGDTTTTLCASLAAFYCKVPVCHVEAGLRTRDKHAPFPEEINRRITSTIADIHCAPTSLGKHNLVSEGVDPSSIHVTGNTVIDAVQQTVAKLRADRRTTARFDKEFSFLRTGERTLLVTAHRRENFGDSFRQICLALLDIARRHPEIAIIFPVHPNPNVRSIVDEVLRGANCGTLHLIEPLDYRRFVYLLDRSYIVLTDSGGLQEECPALRKPVLVMRDATERPEALQAGTARLVGASRRRIVNGVVNLLQRKDDYDKMANAENPFGNGKAGKLIAQIISDRLFQQDRG